MSVASKKKFQVTLKGEHIISLGRYLNLQVLEDSRQITSKDRSNVREIIKELQKIYE